MTAPNRLPNDQPRLEADTDSVHIVWPGGQRSRHLYYWLRENCHCPKCTHPDAWERIVDFLGIPLDIAPASHRAGGDGLHIEWPAHDAPCDGSFFSWTWLDAHRSESPARLARKKRPRTWTANDLDKDALSVDFGNVMASDSGLRQLLSHIDDLGVGFVTGLPCETGTVLVLAERIAFIEESHFGRYFRVESKPNAENLAYTPGSLPPHNDLVSRRYLPGIQFLHCLAHDATGGDSVLVDSVACAEELRRRDRAAFELLSTRAVVFSSSGDTWQIVNRATVIDVDEDGDIVGQPLPSGAARSRGHRTGTADGLLPRVSAVPRHRDERDNAVSISLVRRRSARCSTITGPCMPAMPSTRPAVTGCSRAATSVATIS